MSSSSRNIRLDNLTYLLTKKLLEPDFYKPGQIDILIDKDIFWEFVCSGQLRLGPGKPVLPVTNLHCEQNNLQF